MSSGVAGAGDVGTPLSKVAMITPDDTDAQESEICPKKKPSQVSAGKLDPVNLISVAD
jgi:hypothetical protein